MLLHEKKVPISPLLNTIMGAGPFYVKTPQRGTPRGGILKGPGRLIDGVHTRAFDGCGACMAASGEAPVDLPRRSERNILIIWPVDPGIVDVELSEVRQIDGP